VLKRRNNKKNKKNNNNNNNNNKDIQTAQTLPRSKCPLKVILDSNPDYRINPDAKILWIHYLVGVSHFAKLLLKKNRKNRPMTVWKMLRNLLKSSNPQW